LVVRKAPFGSVDSWECMRLALSFYAAGKKVTVLLEGDGVANWLSGMAPTTRVPSSVSRLTGDLERFGIPVFAVKEDLVERGFLPQGHLASDYLKFVDRRDVPGLISKHGRVFAV
jgi:sulfur relay (sulfurtransferase) DsrF/TusC family protein